MHVVATNICVWIRTLVLESLKEITDYHVRNPHGVPGEGVLGSTRFNFCTIIITLTVYCLIFFASAPFISLHISLVITRSHP